MYPDGHDGTETHNLHQEVFLGNYQSQKISYDLVAYSDGVEGCATNDKRVIVCITLCIYVVAFHWSSKTQPDYKFHRTDSEVYTFYLSTKMVQWIRNTLYSIGFQVSDAPTPIYDRVNLQLIL